jgi:hypothetical protein
MENIAKFLDGAKVFTLPLLKVAYLETRCAPVRVIPDSGPIRKEKYT